MADSNFSAIRARLRYGSLDEFIDGYSRFITRGGMFIPMAPTKLKPVGTTIRFQFLLEDGTTAILGEGVVRQVTEPGDEGSTVGMLVKFTKLSPDTKSLVDRVLRAKDQEQTPIDQTVDTDDAQTAPARQPQPKNDDPPTSELDPEDLSETAKRDAVTQDDADADREEDDLFAQPDEEVPNADPNVTREGESRDAIGLSAAESTGDETQQDDGPGLSAGEVFSEAEDTAPPSDVDEAPVEPAPPPRQEDQQEKNKAPEADGKETEGGPRELGRTEAGLQIMAFDDVTDEDAEEFANFALGGEEDDVDQMFAGIFGDDGDGADGFLDDAFGGGGDDADGDDDIFGGALGGDTGGQEAEDSLFADAEGGAFGGANEDSFIADAEANEPAADAPSDDEFMLESEAESDLEVSEGISPMTNELHTQDIVDEELVDDETDEADLELDLEEESEVDPPGPSFDTQAPPTAPKVQAPAQDAGAEDEDELGMALDELPEEDELVDDDRAEDLSEEILLEEESEEAVEEHEPSERDQAEELLAEADLSREQLKEHLSEQDEPSEELMNLLGSLEDSEVEDTEIELQQLKDDLEEQPDDDGAGDDEESLESLLAVANAEIDEKRKKDEEEKKGDDILDDLLGDDLPPPPSEDSQFDMPLPDEKDKKKKKKKKGFISKLFGKD